MRLSSKTEGFTLTEIIIVVVIIGILMTLGFRGMQTWISRTKQMKTEAALLAIKNSISTYFNDTGSYPQNLMDLVTRPSDPKIASRWKGPYGVVESDIEGDGWKTPFMYQSTKGQKQPYKLYSWGPKGEGSPQEDWIDAWNL